MIDREVRSSPTARQEVVTILDRFSPRTMLPAADLERAKRWYREKLGLTPVEEEPFIVFYESGGTRFAVYPTEFAGTAQNTAMGWSVDDLPGLVEWLRGRGVTFEHYDIEGMEWDGDIASMGPAKAAWFKDSEGNILSITQAM